MTLLAKHFPAANANAAPLGDIVRMECLDGMPSILHASPIFVVSDTRLRVELACFDRIVRPEIVSFEYLSPLVLQALGTSAVLSCVVTKTFDAFELAARLSAMNYSGRYIALGQSIPDKALIRREVRASAPRIDFSVVSVSYHRALVAS